MKFSELKTGDYFRFQSDIDNGHDCLHRKLLGPVSYLYTKTLEALNYPFFDDVVVLCSENGKEIGVPFSEIKTGEYFKNGSYIWLKCIGGVLAFGTVGEPYSSPIICESKAFTETYFVISKPSWINF